MTDVKDADHDTSTKKKKRLKLTNVVEKQDQSSRLQYEENYAEGYIKKLVTELDEALCSMVLTILISEAHNIKNQFEKMEVILKDRHDLLWEFLGFLEPYQALECGKLMAYYEICSMKQFIRNLMSHFKRQPHLLKKIIEKLFYLADQDDLQQCTVEEEVAPFLQKNSLLMQQFLKLLPVEKNPEWYLFSDDTWEDFSIDNEVANEEILSIPHANENIVETKNCIYGCRMNKIKKLCPLCSVKFINGRMYIANGRMLRPANLIFDPSEEVENTKRLADKSYFFTPTIRTRVYKREEANKETNEGSYSQFILATESEEELGDNDPPQRKRKLRNSKRLKVRFETKKQNNDAALLDQTQTDDTAASNDDGSCDDTIKEDNDNDGYVSVDIFSDNNNSCKVEEILNLDHVELNISATGTTSLCRNRASERQSKCPRTN